MQKILIHFKKFNLKLYSLKWKRILIIQQQSRVRKNYKTVSVTGK